MAQTLGQIIGINSFLGGQRYGANWPPESLVPEIKLKRFYLTYGEASETPGIISLDFSWKQWAWKESLIAYKSQGVKTIMATQGGFYYQNQAGGIDKRMPINSTDDPYNPASWAHAVRVCYYIAALYGNNPNAQINPAELQQATQSPYRRATQPIAGQNLVDYIEVGQELLGWQIGWKGVQQVVNARSYAVFFWEACKAIRQADPNMKILVGALVHNDTILNAQFRNEFKILSGVYPEQFPNVIYNFHNYIHNGMLGQPRTTGISPEQVDLKRSYWQGLGAPVMISEFGYDEIQASNQSTPIIAGLNAQQSQWQMNLRNICWYATFTNCIGIIPYEIRNENDGSSGMYSTCGLYTKNYTPKAGLPYVQDFIARAGSFLLPAVHSVQNGVHVFTFADGNTLSYSTGVVQINQIATPPPPTQQPKITNVIYKNVNGQIIAQQPNLTILNYTSAKTTFIAEADTLTKSVKFVLTGVISNTRTENYKPYALFGDNNGVLYGQVFPVGSYSLRITPYTGIGATGTAGNGVLINFRVQ